MVFVTTQSSKQESVIEVSNKKGPGECYHTYDNHLQVLFIVANEDKWIRKKDILNIEVVFYDSSKYNLLFLPKNNELKYQSNIIGNGTMHMYVERKTLLPRKIKAGTVLGEAILIPKIESHFLLLNKEM